MRLILVISVFVFSLSGHSEDVSLVSCNDLLSPKSKNSFYDAENDVQISFNGFNLQARSNTQGQLLMSFPYEGNRALMRSLNDKESFEHMLLALPKNADTAFLIEKYDPLKGRLIGVLNTSFAEIRWYKFERVLRALGLDESKANQDAFILMSARRGLLETVRYMIEQPGAPLLID